MVWEEQTNQIPVMESELLKVFSIYFMSTLGLFPSLFEIVFENMCY